MPDRQHRTRGRLHHALGDAAEQQVRQRAAAVSADHDDIDLLWPGTEGLDGLDGLDGLVSYLVAPLGPLSASVETEP
jgi:hypothetical protein